MAIVSGKSTREGIPPAAFFGAKDFPFVQHGAPLATMLTRAERKGKDLELSGKVPYNDFTLPLVSALDDFAARWARGYTQGPWPLTIALTVAVVDAPMVLARGTPEAPEVAMEPWIRLIRQEAPRENPQGTLRGYVVDFVHREFLASFVANHLVPFAESLFTRVKAKPGLGASCRAVGPRTWPVEWSELKPHSG
jgi:hypothetical protein